MGGSSFQNTITARRARGASPAFARQQPPILARTPCTRTQAGPPSTRRYTPGGPRDAADWGLSLRRDPEQAAWPRAAAAPAALWVFRPSSVRCGVPGIDLSDRLKGDSPRGRTPRQSLDASRERPGKGRGERRRPVLPTVHTRFLYLERTTSLSGLGRRGAGPRPVLRGPSTPVQTLRLLYAVDHSARASMKSAASCVN